ncbi:MAG: radical SAM protein [ANME-2 cluster archaeon]|nr:radical SAM protein [ANME-2 cluster archaeon]
MRISYLALSDTRCTVQVSGCNFKCRGCFSKERHCGGVEISPARIAEQIPTGREVMLAGGEPTIDRVGLLSLIRELDGHKVILSTNGHCLDKALLENLAGITVHIDLKALDPQLHRWYTGKDNGRVLEAIRLLYDRGFDFEVNTVYIPDVVDIDETEHIAAFLSNIGNIRYKIIRYVPVGGFSRRPMPEEICAAVNAARKYLGNVSSSIENRSHPTHRQVVLPDP